jgi:nitrogen fixation protein FixH
MKAERRGRREPWPVALAALLLFMIGASLGFLRVATRHPDAVVGQDASRSLPEPLRAARRAHALGWEIALVAAPEPGGAAVRVALRDGAGAPLAADRVTLRRERPAEGGLDTELALAGAGADWAGAVPLPRPGRWHLVVRAERGEEAAERRFSVWSETAGMDGP